MLKVIVVDFFFWTKSVVKVSKDSDTISSYKFTSHVLQSSFSQTHKVDNVGIIANFVFSYICSFLLHLHQLIVINMKLEFKGYIMITV